MPAERSGELLRETFEGVETSDFQPTEADWGDHDVSASHTEHLSVDERGEDGRMLSAYYPRGSQGVGNGWGGGDFRVHLDTHDELYLAYQVRFREGFYFRGGGKLPGLIGGRNDDIVTGGDNPTGENGWSARMMWRPHPARDPEEGGRLVQYVYYPGKQNADYGENMEWFTAGEWDRTVVGADEWFWVEHRVKMNDPGPEGEEGANDGLIQGWFDGDLALDERDLRFRDVPDFGIDRLYFSSFFGGGRGDPAYGHPREEYIDYDSFVVSEEPITHEG